MPASILASSPFAPGKLPEARAFASKPADLELALEFDEGARFSLVTALLASCCAGDTPSSKVRENVAWNLAVSARIARLLRIVWLTTESENLPVTQACPHDDCRQAFELALPFQSLLAENAESNVGDIVRFPLAESGSIELRLPTGRDQLEWRTQQHENPTAALAAIVRSLMVEPSNATDLPPELIGPIADAMEAADPLVAFAVHTTCPHCQRTTDVPIDLETASLLELARFREQVLADIHVLATHYGWTEAEVLAIPPRRRAEYKKRIAAADRTFP